MTLYGLFHTQEQCLLFTKCQRFSWYGVFSGLSKQEGDLQVNAPLYILGGESEDFFTSLTFYDSAD